MTRRIAIIASPAATQGAKDGMRPTVNLLQSGTGRGSSPVQRRSGMRRWSLESVQVWRALQSELPGGIPSVQLKNIKL